MAMKIRVQKAQRQKTSYRRSKDVTVKIPEGSYTDGNENPGSEGTTTEDIVPPTVEVTYDPTTGDFTVDFSEEPINPNTGTPYTPEEIKDLISQDPDNNVDPDKTIVSQDPNDPTKFIVTTEPKDPSKDVTVKIPEGSYTDGNENPGSEGTTTEDIVPPTVEVSYDPTTGDFTVDFSEEPINPNTGTTYTPEEIKDLISQDPNNNVDPDKTIVSQDPSDPTKFIVTTEPKDPSKDVTIQIPEGSYTDGNENPGSEGTTTEDIVPPTVRIELEESNLEDPSITIKFSEVPCDVNGIPLTAEQIKSLLTTQGFDFDNSSNDGGLNSTDGGLTWTAPITYTTGDAKASISDSSYFDATKNPGSSAKDTLIAPEVISVEPTKPLEVTGGNMGGGKFESGNLPGNPDASKFNKHDLKVDLGTGSDNARIIINLNEVDNAFTLMVNGVDLIKSNNGNKAVFQMESGDTTHGSNQILLKYYDSKGDLQEFGTAEPWNANINGLPRIQVVITEEGVRLFGTLHTTSTELVELYISDADMSRLNLPNLKNGENTISVINPNSKGVDEIKGNVSALSGAGFTISDDDSTEVSKAVIKVTGDLNGTIITPVLPEGMKAVWNLDYSELTLIATNGALAQQDFTDAINLLMFGVKSGQSISAGERKVEITVYDEDGLKSDTATGIFDYKSGLGNIYINQFDFTKPTIMSVSAASADEGNDLIHTIELSKATTSVAEYSFKLGATGDTASFADYGTPTFSNGVSYNATTGIITVPTGVTSFTVSYTTTTDTLAESIETVTLEVGGVTGIGTIIDVPNNIPTYEVNSIIGSFTGTLSDYGYENATTDPWKYSSNNTLTGWDQYNSSEKAFGVRQDNAGVFEVTLREPISSDELANGSKIAIKLAWNNGFSSQAGQGESTVFEVIVGGIVYATVTTPSNGDGSAIDIGKSATITYSNGATGNLTEFVAPSYELTNGDPSSNAYEWNNWEIYLPNISGIPTVSLHWDLKTSTLIEDMTSDDLFIKDIGLYPVETSSIAPASLMMSSFSLDPNDDIIFKLLSDDNLGGNKLETHHDFNLAMSKAIDVSALLSSSATSENISEYLTVKYDAMKDQAVISIDRDGKGTHYQTEDLLILTNQSTNVTLEELLKNNQIII